MDLSIGKNEITRQAGFFAIVGVASTSLNYLTFLIAYAFLSFHYLIAAGTGFVLGVFFGYYFNKKGTFRSTQKIYISLPKYFLVYGLSLAFNIGTLEFLVHNGMSPIIGNIILAPFIIIINFFGTKLIAFQNYKW